MTIGRPSKFTPDRRKAILHAISKHVPYEIAAKANGVSPRRFWEWKAMGEKDLDNEVDSDFAAFSQAINEIEQNKIISHSDIIERGPKNWQANAWLLERRWWQHFGVNAPLIEFKKQLDEMRAMMEKDYAKAA